MKNILVPAGLGLAALGLLYVATTPSAPKAGGAPPPLPPGPQPTGQPQIAVPGFPAVPASNVDTIRQELGTLLAQATIAPNTVNPAALDQLSVELARAGLNAEAQQVKQKSAELKAQIPVV